MEIQSTILFIVALVNSMLSLFVLFGKRNVTNIIYSIFVFFASFWSVMLGFFILERDIAHSLIIANSYYFFAAGIPLFFLYFSFVFPSNRFNVAKTYVVFLSIPLMLIGILFLLDKNFLIQGVWFTEWGKDVSINTYNYILYSLYFLTLTTFAYFNLFSSYRKSKSEGRIDEEKQLKWIIIGTLIGFIFGMVFDLFLPLFGNYKYIYLGPIFSFSMVVAIAYSILKYHLFNIKVVATEMTVFILWVFILVRTVLAESQREQIINVVFLFVMVIVGIILVQSVIREVNQREKIEKLAVDLEHANERLKEVDQLKSEFLSLATHQIRAPLTAIKGYSSLILEGDYGEVPEGILKPVDVISKSCQNLVMIVNDFLNISRIEQGRMKYDLSAFDLIEVTQQVITELRPNIEHTGLVCSCHVKDDKNSVMVYADLGKVKQVIVNLLDNAIKYTPSGSITVEVSKHDNFAQLKVSDTGIGISPEDIKKLFNKFSRAKDANKTNVLGTGLGLYVAKQMIEAQNGKIWIESEGVGKGTTAIVELPLDTHVA